MSMSQITFTPSQIDYLQTWFNAQTSKYVNAVMDDDFDADQEAFEILTGSTFNTTGFKVGSTREVSDTPTKTKKTKKKKDPNAPKRAKTPFMNWMWSDDGVSKVKTTNPDMIHKDAVSEASKVWGTMDDAAKTKWIEMSVAQKVVYESEMESYTLSDEDESDSSIVKTKKVVRGVKKVVDMSDIPSTPDGFDGGMPNMYLAGLASKIKYDTMDAAVDAFSAVDNAGGIVFDGKHFTLRKNGPPKTSLKFEVLWTKTN